jgi:hypothetical protein
LEGDIMVEFVSVTESEMNEWGVLSGTNFTSMGFGGQ